MYLQSIKKFFTGLIILGLASYAAYLQIELKNTVNKYEVSAVETANRFQKINEDALKIREELSRQTILAEEAKAAVEAARASVEEAKRVVEPEVAVKVAEAPGETAVSATKEKVASDPKAKADRAKAAAEAMLERAAEAPKNPWEEREAHL